MKQHVNAKKFYRQSESSIYNQLFIALIALCLYVLVQIRTNSKLTLLQISHYLKAALWKPGYIWLRKIVGKDAS
jgi:putative transposase